MIWFSSKAKNGGTVSRDQLFRLMACFALATIPHWGLVPWWLGIACVALLLWRVFAERRSSPLPSFITRVALALGLFVGVTLTLGTIAGRDAGTLLMIGLLGIKFLELRNTRDYLVISFVLYFLVLIALLFDQSILTFATVLVVIGVVTVNVVSFFSTQNKGAALIPTRGVIRLTGVMLLQALPLALVLFVFFPRVQGKFGFNLGLAKTGLSESIEPGDVSELIFDEELAFRVEFPNEGSQPTQSMYWRAFVLWNFDASSNRWTQGNVEERANILLGGQPLVQIITLPSHGKKWLFALDYPKGPPEPSWLGRMVDGQAIQAKRTINRKLKYEVTSMVGADLVPQSGRLSSGVRQAALSIRNPEAIDERVVKLAASFKEGASGPEEIVRRVLTYFRTENFHYSSSPGRYGPDMLREFLFERREGYCEHFATAMAILLRLAGVPCRMVAGYQGAEHNPYGNFYVVRQANAHAWLEAYVGEKGWQRQDPTLVVSPARIARGPEPVREASGGGLTVEVAGQPIRLLDNDWQPEWLEASLDELDLRWQQVEEMWDRWVLSYNPESQSSLLGSLGMRRMAFAGFIGIGFLSVLATVFLVYLFLRRVERADDPGAEAYRRYCRVLEWAGVSKRRWEGPWDFARRAGEVLPEAREAIDDFTESYVRLRYAKPGSASGAEKHLARQLKRVKDAVAQEAESRFAQASESSSTPS